QDCKSSMLEQEKVERRNLAASVRLGNCLNKRSLGASQDLETEMCDKGRKAEKRSALVKVVRSRAFCGRRRQKNMWLGDRLYECLLRRFARL
ncbi:MAG: hypothetical protein PWP37_1430, partial [Thermotogota bacterium]|nr:hypothetical protein [Thermotogota bacterium]